MLRKLLLSIVALAAFGVVGAGMAEKAEAKWRDRFGSSRHARSFVGWDGKTGVSNKHVTRYHAQSYRHNWR